MTAPEPVTAGGKTWDAVVLVTDADYREYLGLPPKRKFDGRPVEPHRCKGCPRETKRKGYCEACRKARRAIYARAYNKGRARERRLTQRDYSKQHENIWGKP